MVLSNYAGIFILVIMIAGIGLLMFAANKMGKPASVIFIVALIGAYIGPEICESRDFKDSSIETIVTLTLWLMLPPGIIVCSWAFQFWKEAKKRKIQLLKITIIRDFEARKKEIHIEKELLEKELLINNSMHHLLMLLQACTSTNLNFYENRKMAIDREKRNELLKRISDREKEISTIDSQAEDLRFNNNYSQLLNIKRGKIK